MKDLIFVTWLYFQILLVQCNIFVNNLNESDALIKMCIKKTISHVFSYDDTLSLILNNDLCEDAIFEMNTMRPYIVLSMDAINDVKLQYDGQFIICPKDVRSLNRTIHNAHGIVRRNKRTMGNSKILVITNTTDVSWMFEMFWSYGINNVIILVYEQGISKLFTCDRFAPENECGKTAKLMIHQDCEEQLSLSFTNVIQQMNKCPVMFMFQPVQVYADEKNHPRALVVMHVIRELTKSVNATFQSGFFNLESTFNIASRSTRQIVLSYTEYILLDNYAVTEPLLRTDILWMVPKAKQISNMNACMQVFNYDVWIAASAVFISVALLWLFIISRNGGFTFDKLCISFLNVWSLTICGNVTQFPRSRSLALRVILLFYLIYAINMQFAFTSDMSTVLTAPQYGFQIRNLKQLADSQLPIYAQSDFIKFHFNKNNTDRKLYTKLRNSMHSTSLKYADYLLNLHFHGNYAVITTLDLMRNVEIASNKKVEAYEIKDNSMTDVLAVRLRLLIDHYFTTTLNTFISRMVESGIHDKRKNDFFQHRYGAEKLDKKQEDDELTLKHLSFIFKFLGFGLCTASLVFFFELVLNKYL